MYKLKVVGQIASAAKTTEELPLQGLPAQAHIHSEYADALDGIDDCSHIWLICWFHQAQREPLKVVPRRIHADLPPKGVFALRSPVRPNPIALIPTRLKERRGNVLYLEAVDAIDGTPIVDIKPYSVGWDCVFSARNNSTYDLYAKMDRREAFADMLRQAANFHGDDCVGVSIGMRAAYLAMNHFKCNLQEKELTAVAQARGCIADGIQSLLQAGGKRFYKPEPPEGKITFTRTGESLYLEITDRKFESVAAVLAAADKEVFKVIEGRQDHEPSG